MDSIEDLFDQSKTEEGRAAIRSSSDRLVVFSHICDSVCGVVNSFAFEGYELQIQLKIIRTLRNVCCNDTDKLFFDILVSNGIVLKVIDRCKSLTLKKTTDDAELPDVDESKGDSVSIVLAFVQFIANFTANGEHAVQYLVDSVGKGLEPLQDLLAVCSVCRNTKVTSAVLATLYNSFRTSESPSSLARLNLFCTNRQLLCQLLLLVVDSSSGDKDNDKPLSSSDEAMDWLLLMGVVLVRECKVQSIFELVGPSAGADKRIVTHEQVRGY